MKHGNFVSRRWRGDIALRPLFWRDMLAVGTFINVLASFVALMAASQGVDGRVAVALHFLPLPWNLVLARAVWRSPQRTAFHRTVAVTWLVAMTVV